MTEPFDPRRVQHGLVCMLFDPKFAAKVRGSAAIPELGERERELLRGVDPRALATDDMRRARALQVILEEYPVSAALLGVDVVDRFFASPVFRACVFERGSMVLSFGRGWLRDRCEGVGVIETAMAVARRGAAARAPWPGPAGGSVIARAPGVVAVTVPAGTLAWVQRARARLEPEPLRALARLRKPWTQKPPRRGEEHLLIEARADASLAIGAASRPLVELLCAAEEPRSRAQLVAIAIELGAEAHDVEELLDELVTDGLLRESARV